MQLVTMHSHLLYTLQSLPHLVALLTFGFVNSADVLAQTTYIQLMEVTGILIIMHNHNMHYSITRNAMAYSLRWYLTLGSTILIFSTLGVQFCKCINRIDDACCIAIS